MSLEIIADFDGTLTLGGGGILTASSFDVIPHDKPNYTLQADALFNHYRPIEDDHALSLEDKNKYMEEWWRKHLTLFIDEKITREHILETSRRPEICYRPFAKELILFAHIHRVPLLIFSAGLADVIEMKLIKDGLLFDNMTIVGNRFVFDEEGIIVDFKEPIIFTGNKNTIAQQYEKKIHHDTAFVLGDSPQDAHMVENKNHKSVIRVGFLNGKESKRPFFSDFDIVHSEQQASLESFIKELETKITV